MSNDWKIEGNKLIISLNLESKEPSKSGKSYLLASSHGFQHDDKTGILLDEAEGLKPTAMDILKRPMEKAKNTLFIFTCNNPDLIIKPIKSRCAIFEFKPLPESDIIEGLKRIMVKENLSIDNSILQGIVRKVNGDMRQAINELQKAAASNNRNAEIDRIVQQYMKQPTGAILV